MISQEAATAQVDQHQLPPPIGQQDLDLEVFASANFMR
jgi:hypothetical protein